MRARTSGAAAVALLLVVRLVAPASTGAEELGAAAGARSEARSDRPDSPEAGVGFESDRYERVLVSPLRVAYTDDPDLERRRGGNSKLAPEDLLRFQRYYREAVEKQLGKTYPILTEPSANALRIDAVLVDPVVDKRGWNAAAKRVYREQPTLRLVVMLRDSRSDDLLHQVELPARLGSGRWAEQNAVIYWGQIRLIFAQLATRVQLALEGADQPVHF